MTFSLIFVQHCRVLVDVWAQLVLQSSDFCNVLWLWFDHLGNLKLRHKTLILSLLRLMSTLALRFSRCLSLLSLCRGNRVT